MQETTIDKTGAVVNFILRAGTKWNQTLTFNNADGTPLDLSQYDEIHIQVRKKPGMEVVMEGLLTENTLSVTGVGNNNLNIVGLQCPDEPGSYNYDIDFISVSSLDSLIYGHISIVDQITIQT